MVNSVARSCWLWLKRLYMLVWKNVHIRWRTSSVGCSHRLLGRVPIFLLIEVLWPIVLYIIVVGLRANFPPNQKSEYLYHPIALPSAGSLPFVQSLLCDLDQNGRHGYADMPNYPNADVNDVYSLLDEFGSLNGTLDSFCSTIHSLTETASCVNSTTNLGSPQCQQDMVPLTCYLGDPDGFERFLTSDLQFSPTLTQGILGATVDTSVFSRGFPFRTKRQLPSFPFNLPGLLGNGVGGVALTPAELRALVCVRNGTIVDNFVDFENVSTADVSTAVCNLNSSQFTALASELQSQLVIPQTCTPLDGLSSVSTLQRAPALFQQFRNLSNSALFGNVSYGGADEEGGLGVEQSMRFLCGDTATNGSSFQNILISTLFGNDYQQSQFEAEGGNKSIPPDKVTLKILYSPHTNFTESVMSKAARVFQTFQYLQDWAWQITNCSNEFLINFAPYSTQANSTRQLITALLGDDTASDSTTTLVGNITIEEAVNFINQLQETQNLTLNTSSLEAVQKLLNPNASGNIWETVTKIRDVASGIYDMLDRFDWDVFYPLPDEAALEALAADYSQQKELNISTVLGGVVFEGVNGTSPTIKIRMNVSTVVDTTEIKATVWTPGPESKQWKKRYLFGTFIFIQDMVERAMAEELVSQRIHTPGLYLQQMPYPCYKKDSFVVSMEFVLALAMLFAWLFPVAMTVRAIVREKETRLKEYIKMVGVSDTQLRLSRLLVSGMILLVSVCFITLFLKIGNVLPLTDWFILFLFLCLYALVMLGYSFLVSTLFNNANLAACVASLLYFMVLFGHTVIVSKQQYMSPFTVGLCCLWAPLAFALGAQYMVEWEVQQVGINWSNMGLLTGTDAQLSFLSIAIMLVVDTLLYFLATWYIEGVAPGRYGVAKPFYFPFMPSYWFGQKGRGWFKRGHKGHMKLDGDSPREGGAVCEDDPAGLTLGITMENLSKTYQSCLRRKKVTAVKNLSLNFYEGQITALLGHNGAGKTTTLSILAGLFEPTSGTARIYGNSIRRHMDLIRQGLGICPQHNVLFSELTVEEHLLFFGQLKGLSRSESLRQIPEWLSKVDLLPHATKLAKHLSGGMKRKLSILLAFVGGSRTIILDEPTAGVDPFARRQIWDFLLRQRDGRTIILSTHHMDEAEILGDRIAIVSQGSLVCCGSFEFLKHRFGRGHTLTLVTASQSYGGSEGVETVTEFLKGFVTSVKLEEVRGRELHYLLPLSGARGSVLTQLFAELERSKERLGVASYGLTACSMEEIFVDLTEKEAFTAEDGTVPRHSKSFMSVGSTNSETTPPETGTTTIPECPEDEDVFEEDGPLVKTNVGKDESGGRLRLLPLWLSQFWALTVKRFHYTKRRFLALAIQNILPIGLILLSLGIAQALQSVGDPPPIELSPSHLFAVNKDNYMFVGGYHTNTTEPYIQSLFQPCGVGGHMTAADPAQCFHGNQYSQYNSTSTYTCAGYPQDQYQCTCYNGTEADCFTPDPFHEQNRLPSCYNGTGTGSRVQNVTLPFNPDNPSLGDEALTTYLLRSKNFFLQKRYGGLSFGHERSEVDPSLDEDVLEDVPFLATRASAKVWFSAKAYHAMPSYLNVMNNALMRGSLPPAKQSQYGFRTISHPFKTSDLSKLLYAVKEKNSFLVNPLAVMFSFGFVVAGFVLILIEERSGNVKHLQLVCGMNKGVYWLANTIWDFLWYLGFMFLTLALYLAFQDPFYTDREVFPLFLLILLCYGVAVTPWVYALSFLFQSPATAYVVLFCLNFFGGFCVLFIDAVLLFLNDDLGDKIPLHYSLATIPVPAYPLARSMMYLSSDHALYKVAAQYSVNFTLPNPYEELAPFMGAQFGQAIFCVTVLMIIELWPYIRTIFGVRLSSTSLPPPLDPDEDVRRERSKISNGEGDDDIVTINGLSKVYKTDLCRGQRRVAVNQLCLGVRKGECFGLLGVNGAGKTTTFKMLTGDIRPSAGDALIAGHRLSQSRRPAQQSLGYCPQVDALIDQLTGRQHLTLFCRLRGLCGRDVRGVVEQALVKLGLSQYADRPVSAYSGGNRRKLSTAISLLANPPLILLDEPTSGVDPRARHFLWSVVRGIVNGGQSVVLTTHSMAECEALCSRVAIMVNGEFHCLGSPQQLKSTYGHGYRLKLRVAGQVEPVKEFVRQNFPGSVLKEEHYTTLVYQIPTSESLLLHNVFESMEQARQTLDIQDYSVSQTTLDDVFIHFASEQSEEAGLLGETHPSVADATLPDIIPLHSIQHMN